MQLPRQTHLLPQAPNCMLMFVMRPRFLTEMLLLHLVSGASQVPRVICGQRALRQQELGREGA